MDRDELIKDAYQWIDDGACDVYNEPGEAMADFALGIYEAGRRAERERIADKIEDIQYSARSTGEYVVALRSLMKELGLTEPAESGE